MRHVLDTEGGRALVVELRKNVFRAYKRHLQQPLCASVIEGCPCPDGQQCLHIHVTPEGYADRRLWVDPSHRPRPVSNATVDFLTVTPADRRPLLPPRPPLPPVAQDGGASSEFCAEFRPCGPYLPSPYVTAPHPSPYRPIIPPFLHENGSLHEDLTVAQQRTQQTRHRLRTNVDGILAQTLPVGPPGAMRPGPHPHGPPQVFPAAGLYAPSYYHSISHPPHPSNRSAPYSLWVPPPHMGPS